MSGSGRLLIFGGTTEARELLARGLPALYSTATEYGAELAEGLPGVEPQAGRLDASGMEQLIRDKGVTCVIDATHPYAVEVSRNIRTACLATNTPLRRVLRTETAGGGEEDGACMRVSSCREAAELLNRRSGSVLLTVGSKELKEFTAVENYRERLYVRVLPTAEVLRSCEALGFLPNQILAMQGPFSEAMNRAMLEMTGASVLVTKDGGAAGGAAAKLAAARSMGVEVLLISRPDDSGCSVDEALLWARRLLGLDRPPLFPAWCDLEGKEVLIAGGGAVALRRAETFARCGARLRVVSPEFHSSFPQGSELLARCFRPDDLDEASFAVAATDDRSVNHLIGMEARRRGIPVSVADAAAESTFYFPSLITEGPSAASVSTAGLSPSLARRLSDRLREVWARWVREEMESES
ncbi:MAG: precorrin-6A reductase [Fretibacterium sp.]|nr:precorrin-6A reductase [Fretibacterium sp.]